MAIVFIDWVIQNFPSLTAAIATIVLAVLNYRLLGKYDKKHKIDLFYYSYSYRKDLREKIFERWEQKFSRKFAPENDVKEPWPHKDDSNNSYNTLVRKLEEACRVFPNQKIQLGQSIHLVKELNGIIGEISNKKGDLELKNKLKMKMNEIHDNMFSVPYLDKELEFPRN